MNGKAWPRPVNRGFHSDNEVTNSQRFSSRVVSERAMSHTRLAETQVFTRRCQVIETVSLSPLSSGEHSTVYSVGYWICFEAFLQNVKVQGFVTLLSRWQCVFDISNNILMFYRIFGFEYKAKNLILPMLATHIIFN